MRNCFFYYIYFLCKLQYNFHVIHFFVKITNHCLVLFVIFHIKHHSFPLRELSSSGYSQSASLRSSIPNNCSAFHQKELIFYPYQKLITMAAMIAATMKAIDYLYAKRTMLCIVLFTYHAIFINLTVSPHSVWSLQ